MWSRQLRGDMSADPSDCLDALCAKVRELQGERAGMAAKYALVCTERDRSQEDYDQARQAGDDYLAKLGKVEAEYDAALAQVARMRDFFDMYAGHHGSCSCFDSGSCSCGFTATYTAIAAHMDAQAKRGG